MPKKGLKRGFGFDVRNGLSNSNVYKEKTCLKTIQSMVGSIHSQGKTETKSLFNYH